MLHKHVPGNELEFDALVDFFPLSSESRIDSKLAKFNGEVIRFPCCHQIHCLVTSWQASVH